MPVATIGAPVPDNLEAMTLEDIHALHSSIWAERTALKLKHASILPILHVKQLQRDMETRAGFDQVIGQGRTQLNVSVETAKDMLESAKAGAITLTKSVLDRLKQIAGVK